MDKLSEKLVEIIDAIQKGAPGVAERLIAEWSARAIVGLVAGVFLMALGAAAFPFVLRGFRKDFDASDIMKNDLTFLVVAEGLAAVACFVAFIVGVSFAVESARDMLAPTIGLIQAVRGK